MTDGAAYLLRGDALHLPLADESVDLVVTSPPFFALRSYTDAGTHYAGQLGDEPTPAEFLANLWAATRELVRVLKPSGSIWLELGDKYSTGSSGQSGLAKLGERYRGGGHSDGKAKRRSAPAAGFPPKSLLGLPWAFALGCTGALATLGGPDPGLGLILRAEVIHEHTNGLPESVKDRVRRSHSTWFHLVKQPRYYAGVDEIREAQKVPNAGRNSQTMQSSNGGSQHRRLQADPAEYNPLGKLPGSVWSMEESIWDGPIVFCPRCGRNLMDAGSGPAGRTEKVTVPTGSPTSARSERTDSLTSSTSDPSLTDSPSTTSAETEDASDPTTSSPSPASRTSPEETPPQPETLPRPTASTATSSPQPTRITVREAPASAGCACETASAHDAPGSVWSLPSEPLRVPEHLGIDHYAAFSTEIVRRIVLGWSPHGICCECGQGRAPIVDKREIRRAERSETSQAYAAEASANGRSKFTADVRWMGEQQATILGYACACVPYTDWPGTGNGTKRRDYNPVPDARPQGTYGRHQAGEYHPVSPWREYHLDGWKAPPTRPAVVLDPFAGTGTTVMVARALGRFGIGLDLSADYLRLATWRIWHSGDHAKAVSRTNLERQGSLL